MYKPYRKLNPKVDNKNWQVLFNTQFQNMQSLGAISTIWVNGFSKLGVDNARRPTVDELNKVSKKYTGYRFIQTKRNVIMSGIEWYQMAARYEMPLTNFVRKPAELDYCDEPDFFHEFMGHVCFFVDKEYSDMYQRVARLYIDIYKSKNRALIQKIDFISGYILELGLIKEPTGIKALGATLYSSGEIKEAFKKKNQRMLGNEIPRNKESYDRSSHVGEYYVVESIDYVNKLLLKIKNEMK